MQGSRQHSDQPHQQLSDTITAHKLQHTAISTKNNETHSAHLQQVKREQPGPVIDIRSICWVWTYDNRSRSGGTGKYINQINKKAAQMQRVNFMSCSLREYKNCRCDWVSDQSITEVKRPMGSCALTWSISTPASKRTRKRLCFKQDRQGGFTQNCFHHHTVPILSLMSSSLFLFARSIGFWLSTDSTSSQEWRESRRELQSTCDYGSRRLIKRETEGFTALTARAPSADISGYSFLVILGESCQPLPDSQNPQRPAWKRRKCCLLSDAPLLSCSIGCGFHNWLNANQLTHRHTHRRAHTHRKKKKHRTCGQRVLHNTVASSLPMHNAWRTCKYVIPCMH